MAIKRDQVLLDAPPAYNDEDHHNTIYSDFAKLPEKRISIEIKSDIDFQDAGELPSLTPVTSPIIFSLPDPHSIRCRCGEYHDTTVESSGNLPDGIVRCPCGYIVSSAGWARWEPRTVACPTVSCFSFIPWPQKERYVCKCGVGLDTDASVCIPVRNWKRDLSKVRCRCGKYVDTTKRCVVIHKDNVMYEYALPDGSARCECGRTVRANGTSVQEHPVECCSVKVSVKGARVEKSQG